MRLPARDVCLYLGRSENRMAHGSFSILFAVRARGFSRRRDGAIREKSERSTRDPGSKCSFPTPVALFPERGARSHSSIRSRARALRSTPESRSLYADPGPAPASRTHPGAHCAIRFSGRGMEKKEHFAHMDSLHDSGPPGESVDDAALRSARRKGPGLPEERIRQARRTTTLRDAALVA